METQKIKSGGCIYDVLKALESFYSEAREKCLTFKEINVGYREIIYKMIDDNNLFGKGFCEGYWFLLTEKTWELLSSGVWENDVYYTSDYGSEHHYSKQGLTEDEYFQKRNNPDNLSGLFWLKDLRKNYTMP